MLSTYDRETNQADSALEDPAFADSEPINGRNEDSRGRSLKVSIFQVPHLSFTCMIAFGFHSHARRFYYFPVCG